MSYIAPNTIVKLLQGCPCDKGYQHTLYFKDEEQQQIYLNGLVKYTFTEQSYQRHEKGSIRLAVKSDNVLDCNYMMFQNTSFGTKWFYAFIDKVEYINNECTEIWYTIDVMQTWYFDYELGQCFVEREHSQTDEIGQNIVPENLEIGEKVCIGTKRVIFDKMLGGLVTTKQLPNQYAKQIGDVYYFTPTFTPQSANWDAPCGVTTNLYIYTGIPIERRDIEYFKENNTIYRLDTFWTWDYETVAGEGNLMTLGELLSIIADGSINGVDILEAIDESAIVGVFQYPAELDRISFQNGAKNSGYKDGISKFIVDDLQRPDGFKGTGTSYVPKNKKLLTYPFMELVLSNNAGQTASFKYENFNDTPSFECVGNYTMPVTLLMYPLNHKHIINDVDSGITLGDFPEPAFHGDNYAQWLNQNRASFASSLISSAISTALGISMGNPITATMTATRGIESVFGSLAKVSDIQNTPPQLHGQVNNSSLKTGINKIEFTFYHYGIKAEFAKIIDGYFDMFGYATNLVKVPNVRDPNAKLRPFWNYIKTKSCTIHPVLGRGLPSEDEEEIAKIYNNGITFWMNKYAFGDYSCDNRPT